MILSLIVAKSINDVIGIDNQLPWHLPADLKYFKHLTTGHTIIMGRKTFESIGRPLPNRKNVVITRDKKFNAEGIHVKNSIDEAIEFANIESDSNEEVFIIGGDTIYQQTLELADKLYITQVNTIIENGTSFFPKIDSETWKSVSSESHLKDEKNQFDYSFEIYEKK